MLINPLYTLYSTLVLWETIIDEYLLFFVVLCYQRVLPSKFKLLFQQKSLALKKNLLTIHIYVMTFLPPHCLILFGNFHSSHCLIIYLLLHLSSDWFYWYYIFLMAHRNPWLWWIIQHLDKILSRILLQVEGRKCHF